MDIPETITMDFHLNEIEQIVDSRAAIRFQIDVSNVNLAEMLGVTGEEQRIQ